MLYVSFVCFFGAGVCLGWVAGQKYMIIAFKKQLGQVGVQF